MAGRILHVLNKEPEIIRIAVQNMLQDISSYVGLGIPTIANNISDIKRIPSPICSEIIEYLCSEKSAITLLNQSGTSGIQLLEECGIRIVDVAEPWLIHLQALERSRKYQQQLMHLKERKNPPSKRLRELLSDLRLATHRDYSGQLTLREFWCRSGVSATSLKEAADNINKSYIYDYFISPPKDIADIAEPDLNDIRYLFGIPKEVKISFISKPIDAPVPSGFLNWWMAQYMKSAEQSEMESASQYYESVDKPTNIKSEENGKPLRPKLVAALENITLLLNWHINKLQQINDLPLSTTTVRDRVIEVLENIIEDVQATLKDLKAIQDGDNFGSQSDHLVATLIKRMRKVPENIGENVIGWGEKAIAGLIISGICLSLGYAASSILGHGTSIETRKMIEECEEDQKELPQPSLMLLNQIAREDVENNF